jgi:hypothetical protein
MDKRELMNPNRRAFLVSVSAAAATSLVFADSTPVLAQAGAQAGATPAPAAFQLITAETIVQDMKALDAAPGSNNLATHDEFAVVLTTETAHGAKEFEWHEGRDHILQVIDGTTVYELGGTPRDAHSLKAGRMARTSIGWSERC